MRKHAGSASPDATEMGWWDGIIGPGKGLDTDRYFVVCSNILGSCYGTTGPASIDPGTGKPYRLSCPQVSVRDMVRAQRLLLESLGVLASFPRRGAYPLLDDVACRWCPYASACRKDHAPTASRHEREDADLRDLRRKPKSKAPTLALVRGGERA